MGLFTDKPQKEFPFLEIFCRLLGMDSVKEFEVEQFCDDGEGELNRYNVYKITADKKCYVLKKSDEREKNIYQNFLAEGSFKVPCFYGSIEVGGILWILIEYIEGVDLRDFTEEEAYACADSITAMPKCSRQISIKRQYNKKNAVLRGGNGGKYGIQAMY